MTGQTPLYRIPYPDAATKANKLGDELALMGAGVEAALIAAGVPAATNPDRIAAPSVAARDAYFGIPSTEAARVALQARGAETMRTDRGWTERFYASYDAATNPGGVRTAAGWYPTAGRLPYLRATFTNNNQPAGWGNASNWVATAQEGGLWTINGASITPPVLGRYTLTFDVPGNIDGLRFVGLVHSTHQLVTRGVSGAALLTLTARDFVTGAVTCQTYLEAVRSVGGSLVMTYDGPY